MQLLMSALLRQESDGLTPGQLASVVGKSIRWYSWDVFRWTIHSVAFTNIVPATNCWMCTLPCESTSPVVFAESVKFIHFDFQACAACTPSRQRIRQEGVRPTRHEAL